MSGSRGTPHGGMRLGLARGGGAVLGAAHAGLLQAIDEAGIGCEVIVGTSAGALIGGGYAARLTGGELTELVLTAQKDVPQLVDVGRHAMESSLEEVFQKLGDLPARRSLDTDCGWIDCMIS